MNYLAGSVYAAEIRHTPLSEADHQRTKARIRAAFLARDITHHGYIIAETLLGMLGRDGRCDPTHSTLAALARSSERTVRRVLNTLRDLGILDWINTVLPTAQGRRQTSNNYLWTPDRKPLSEQPHTPDGQTGRQVIQKVAKSLKRPSRHPCKLHRCATCSRKSSASRTSTG